MNRDIGHLDCVKGSSVEGWAIDSEDAETPAALDVLVDGRIIGSANADLYREDLREVGIRNGYAAFAFNIPLVYYDGEEHRVDVVLRDAKIVLPNSPLTFRGVPGDMPLVAQRREWAERRILIRKSARAGDLPARIRERKKLAILSTYHSASHFFAYHQALADALMNAGFVTLVVHAGDNIGRGLDEFDGGDLFLFVKRNIGYDFGSWAVGVYAVSDLLRDVDELILINDSIIGPAFDIGRILQKIKSADADLVGLTDSYERAYHLQSYFVWFGPRICRSSTLQVFMAQYSFSSDKETVIQEGELGLTRFFMDEGFETSALYAYENVAGAWLEKAPQLLRTIEALPLMDLARSNIDGPGSYRSDLLQRVEGIVSSIVRGEPLNPAHFFWDILLEDFGHPFLKRELLFVNPSCIPTYFRIPELLSRLSPSMQTHMMEARRRYGGKLVPFAKHYA